MGLADFCDTDIAMDRLGTALLFGSLVDILILLQVSFFTACLCRHSQYSLQDGGVKYSWGSSTAVGLIVGFVLIQAAFWGVQLFMGEQANIPLRILGQRTILTASLTNFCIGASYFSLAYVSGLVVLLWKPTRPHNFLVCTHLVPSHRG